MKGLLILFLIILCAAQMFIAVLWDSPMKVMVIGMITAIAFLIGYFIGEDES